MDKKVFSRALLLHSSFVGIIPTLKTSFSCLLIPLVFGYAFCIAVEALKKVGKEDWDFSKDPCSGEGNWSVLDLSKGFEGL
jgi:hypothetical protein